MLYFERECDCDLLFTTSHRVCDGLSVFIIVKDVLRSLAGGAELEAHDPLGATDIIGKYRPAWLWLTSIGVPLINTCLRLFPASLPTPRKKGIFCRVERRA